MLCKRLIMYVSCVFARSELSRGVSRKCLHEVPSIQNRWFYLDGSTISEGGCMLCKHLIVQFLCVFARSGFPRGVSRRWDHEVPSIQNRWFYVDGSTISEGVCMLCKHLILHFPCVFAHSGLSRGVSGRWGREVPSIQNRWFYVDGSTISERDQNICSGTCPSTPRK